MTLSIIIVNYKSVGLISDCLATAYADPALKDVEILIVDNSGDDASELCVAFPALKWITMPYNAGFARANNRGIAESTGDVVLLLNPDILLQSDAVSRCFRRLAASDYVAGGVQLLNADRTPQVTGSYFIRGGINQFLPLPVLGRLFKWLGNQSGVRKTSIAEAKAETEVDWINGAFLMVKKTAIEKAGLLDEDFFLYYEEIEWCARLRREGRLVVYGDLHAIHLQGETANESFGATGKGYYQLWGKKGRQLMLSAFVRIRKQFGAGWFLLHLLVYFAEVPLSFLLALSAPLRRKSTYGFPEFSGYLRNLLYVLRHSGSILANRRRFYKAG